jgi:hypothetical protein
MPVCLSPPRATLAWPHQRSRADETTHMRTIVNQWGSARQVPLSIHHESGSACRAGRERFSIVWIAVALRSRPNPEEPPCFPPSQAVTKPRDSAFAFPPVAKRGLGGVNWGQRLLVERGKSGSTLARPAPGLPGGPRPSIRRPTTLPPSSRSNRTSGGSGSHNSRRAGSSRRSGGSHRRANGTTARVASLRS